MGGGCGKCPSVIAPYIEDQGELLGTESDTNAIPDVLIEVCDTLNSISAAAQAQVSGFEVLPQMLANATMKAAVVFSLRGSVPGSSPAPAPRNWGHMCGRVTRKSVTEYMGLQE